MPYFDRYGESEITRKKRKVAYTCSVCEDKVWGKPEVRPQLWEMRIRSHDCSVRYKSNCDGSVSEARARHWWQRWH